MEQNRQSRHEDVETHRRPLQVSHEAEGGQGRPFELNTYALGARRISGQHKDNVRHKDTGQHIDTEQHKDTEQHNDTGQHKDSRTAQRPQYHDCSKQTPTIFSGAMLTWFWLCIGQHEYKTILTGRVVLSCTWLCSGEHKHYTTSGSR